MVLTPVTLTPNSASTAALISGLVARGATLNTTELFSDSMVDFSVMCGESTMSKWCASGAACCFLAIEPGLQLFDRSAGQNQRVVPHDVVNIGAERGHQVDALEVRRSAGEADVQCVAVDHQRGLAEAELPELRPKRLGLALGDVEVVEDDEVAVTRLGRQRHLQAERANLLVEARREHPGAGAMSLAAADEDRRLAVAVAGGSPALLAAELLARAIDVAALTRGARRSAAVDQLPGDDAMEDVGARLDPKDIVLELDVAASLGVEGPYLDLHLLAFLAFGGVGGRLDAVLGRAGLFIVCGLGRVDGFSFGCFGGLGL